MKQQLTELETMRADLKNHNMPKKLMLALGEYEELRKKYTYDSAQALIDNLLGDKTGLYLDRLVRGLKMVSLTRSAIPVAKRNGLDRRYILKKRDYFTSLNGLFYFNGCDVLVSKILKKAWCLGYIPRN